MLRLPDVTLACPYTIAHDLHQMAIDECLRRVDFGDVKLFTDKPAGRDEIHVDTFSGMNKIANFIIYDVPGYIRTSHILFIHWDSWVVDPGMWTDEFLKYDYVGAPWWYRDGYNVGNSGFCLRSKRLMDFVVDHRAEFPIRDPEDDTLCRRYRRQLEPQFRWAPEPLAHQFSFERVRASPRSFGFHGVFNFPAVMEPGALRDRLRVVAADPYTRRQSEFREIAHFVEEPT